MASSRTIAERLKVSGLVSDGSTGTVNGDGMDTKGLEQVCVYLHTGTPSSGGTLDVKLQHSDDDGSADAYADIPGAVYSQKTDAAGDETVHVAWLTTNLPGKKRYIRPVSVVATAAYPHGVTMVAGGAHEMPVSHPNGVEWKVDQTA